MENEQVVQPDETQNVEVPEQPAEQVEPEVQPEQVEAPVEVPVEAPEVEEEEDDPVPTFNLPQAQPQQPQVQTQPVPPLNPQDFSDEYGNVDMGKFAQAMQQRDAQLAQSLVQNLVPQLLQQTSQQSSQQIVAMRQEERAWKQAEKAYPQIAENKELRDLVHNTRLNYTSQGAKQISPKQAADKLFKYISSAKQEGQREATESVRVQASAHLESAANTANETAVRTREFANDIGHKQKPVARQARENLIKDWIKEGKIQLPS